MGVSQPQVLAGHRSRHGVCVPDTGPCVALLTAVINHPPSRLALSSGGPSVRREQADIFYGSLSLLKKFAVLL